MNSHTIIKVRRFSVALVVGLLLGMSVAGLGMSWVLAPNSTRP